jgi:hypothetical protein
MSVEMQAMCDIAMDRAAKLQELRGACGRVKGIVAIEGHSHLLWIYKM